MKKSWFLVLLSVSIVLSAFVARTVVASGDDGSEETDNRELKTTSDSDSVKVESKFENQTMENKYEIKLSTEEGIRLDLGFSSETNATEFELEAKVSFLRLIEFIDQNGDGVPNATEEVQTIDLTTKTYSSPTITQTTSQDGKLGYRFESHSIGESFTFQIIAEIFPTQAIVNDTTVKPTESKITITVKDFPYVGNGSLALTVKATSEAEMEEEVTGTEKEVEIKSGTAEGYFSWSKEALVDGISREVKSSVVDTDKGKLIALSYPNGKNIVHDPKLGISLFSPIAGLPWLYIAAGAALIALAVAVAIKAFRPRMQAPVR